MSKDGGPAFPTANDRLDMPRGMSMRDYFAAAAMQAMLRADTDNGRNRTEADVTRTAGLAYRAADAMLKERAK